MDKKIMIGGVIAVVLLLSCIVYQQYEIMELGKTVEKNLSSQEEINAHNSYLWSIQVEINQDILDIFELMV